MRPLNLQGGVYGRLAVIDKAPSQSKGTLWNCLCDCGQVSVVRGTSLIKGGTKSCGCLNLEKRTKHGDTKGTGWTVEYGAWENMKSRCYNENATGYEDYGGRGIKVCDRWLASYENFLEDMGRKPGKGYSIDRINVDGNYEPSNCRWTTTFEQARNKRRHD